MRRGQAFAQTTKGLFLRGRRVGTRLRGCRQGDEVHMVLEEAAGALRDGVQGPWPRGKCRRRVGCSL